MVDEVLCVWWRTKGGGRQGQRKEDTVRVVSILRERNNTPSEPLAMRTRRNEAASALRGTAASQPPSLSRSVLARRSLGGHYVENPRKESKRAKGAHTHGATPKLLSSNCVARAAPEEARDVCVARVLNVVRERRTCGNDSRCPHPDRVEARACVCYLPAAVPLVARRSSSSPSDRPTDETTTTSDRPPRAAYMSTFRRREPRGRGHR